jgi:hypothetical protein
MTLEEIKTKYPRIQQPPHAYYDLRNEKRSSPFPPGETPEFYQPFIDYFLEREQTAKAQARLYRRKGKLEDAERFESYAGRWYEAAQVAANRQTRSFLDRQLEAADPKAKRKRRP